MQATKWYILAEREMPEEGRYDGYIQLENGVGMLRLLQEEGDGRPGREEGRRGEGGRTLDRDGIPAVPVSGKACEGDRKGLSGTKRPCISDRNDFFGEKITVAGLITGRGI